LLYFVWLLDHPRELAAIVWIYGIISPKMNMPKLLFRGKPFDHGNSNETENLLSELYVTIASCWYDAPLDFPVSGGSGNGLVVVPTKLFVTANLWLVPSE
jgi:hypothetical protein